MGYGGLCWHSVLPIGSLTTHRFTTHRGFRKWDQADFDDVLVQKIFPSKDTTKDTWTCSFAKDAWAAWHIPHDIWMSHVWGTREWAMSRRHLNESCLRYSDVTQTFEWVMSEVHVNERCHTDICMSHVWGTREWASHPKARNMRTLIYFFAKEDGKPIQSQPCPIVFYFVF